MSHYDIRTTQPRYGNEKCAIWAEKSRDEQSASPSRRLLSEKNTSMLQRME